MWPLFLALLLAPLVGGLAWWLTRADRLDAAALARVAAARGWATAREESEDDERHTLSPREGGWTLTVTRRKPRSRGHSSRSGGLGTTWRAPTSGPTGTLVARPGARPTGPFAPPPALLRGLFERALAELGVDGPVGELVPLSTGDAAFDAAVTVVTDAPDRVLGAEERAAILDACNQGAMVVVSGDTIQLSRKGQADERQIDALVVAGVALRAHPPTA